MGEGAEVGPAARTPSARSWPLASIPATLRIERPTVKRGGTLWSACRQRVAVGRDRGRRDHQLRPARSIETFASNGVRRRGDVTSAGYIPLQWQISLE